MSAYVLGLVVWQLDLQCCHLLDIVLPATLGVPNPQLHAWWHVLVSLGFYLLITLAAFDRLRVLSVAGRNGPPALHWACGCVPWVSAEAAKQA